MQAVVPAVICEAICIIRQEPERKRGRGALPSNNSTQGKQRIGEYSNYASDATVCQAAERLNKMNQDDDAGAATVLACWPI
jgi:hypothetical protein